MTGVAWILTDPDWLILGSFSYWQKRLAPSHSLMSVLTLYKFEPKVKHIGTKVNHYGPAAVSNEIKPTWQHEWILLIAKNISQAAWRSLAAVLFVMAGCQIQLQRRQEILFCNLHLCDCVRLSNIEVAKIKCCRLNADGSSPSGLEIIPKAF